jgi:plasmid stability protein
VAAITVRRVPEEVHGGLRRLAEARRLSVEALVRVGLAEMVRREAGDTGAAPMTGFGEASGAWGSTGAADATGASTSGVAPGELWGALKGSVHVPAETDLTAPPGESWEAGQ